MTGCGNSWRKASWSTASHQNCSPSVNSASSVNVPVFLQTCPAIYGCNNFLNDPLIRRIRISRLRPPVRFFPFLFSSWLTNLQARSKCGWKEKEMVQVVASYWVLLQKSNFQNYVFLKVILFFRQRINRNMHAFFLGYFLDWTFALLLVTSQKIAILFVEHLKLTLKFMAAIYFII